MAEYIERQAGIKAFENADPDVMADYGPEYGSEWGFSRDAIKAVIGNIPAADVAPVVHGRWLKDDTGVICCSECGEEHEWEDYRASYCDTCGAKMQEVR